MTKPSVRRVLQATAVSAALIVGTLLASPNAAFANSLSCNKGFTTGAEGFYGNCTGGAPGDQFRPWVTCHLQGHSDRTFYGVWKHNGLTNVYCPTGYDALTGDLQKSSP